MFAHRPPNLLMVLIYLLGGLFLAAIFVRTCYPDSAISIWETLSGNKLVVLAMLLLAGLVVVSLLARLMSALMQVLMSLLQVALVLGLIGGGIYLFHQSRQSPSRTPPVVYAPLPDNVVDDTPAPQTVPASSSTKKSGSWWEQNPYE